MEYARRRFHIDGYKDWKFYKIYTKSEADKANIQYKPWRECSPGDWGLDDAGFVSECVKKQIKRRGNSVAVFLQFPFCKASISTPGKFGYGISKDRHWAEVDAGKTAFKLAVRAYVAVLIQKGKLTDEDWHIIGSIARHDQKKPSEYFKRWMKHKPAKDLVLSEIVSYMAEAGITPRSVISGYQEVLEKATNKGQLQVSKSILDKFAELLDMKPAQRRIEAETEIIDWSNFQIEENDDKLLGPRAGAGEDEGADGPTSHESDIYDVHEL